MIIKKAVYKTKMEKVRRQVSPEVHGCDECKTEIDPNASTRLECTIFKQDRDTDKKSFCSWNCVFSYLPKIKSDYFVTLPYVHFDERKTKKGGAKELISILKKLKQ